MQKLEAPACIDPFGRERRARREYRRRRPRRALWRNDDRAVAETQAVAQLTTKIKPAATKQLGKRHIAGEGQSAPRSIHGGAGHELGSTRLCITANARMSRKRAASFSRSKFS